MAWIRCVVSVFAILVGGLLAFASLSALLDSYGLSQERGVPLEIGLNTVFLIASLASAGLFVALAVISARASRRGLSAMTIVASLGSALMACYVVRVSSGLYNPRRGGRWSMAWAFILVAASACLVSATLTAWLTFFGRGRIRAKRATPDPGDD